MVLHGSCRLHAPKLVFPRCRWLSFRMHTPTNESIATYGEYSTEHSEIRISLCMWGLVVNNENVVGMIRIRPLRGFSFILLRRDSTESGSNGCAAGDGARFVEWHIKILTFFHRQQFHGRRVFRAGQMLAGILSSGII
jgi:hypothetical protein